MGQLWVQVGTIKGYHARQEMAGFSIVFQSGWNEHLVTMDAWNLLNIQAYWASKR